MCFRGLLWLRIENGGFNIRISKITLENIALFLTIHDKGVERERRWM